MKLLYRSYKPVVDRAAVRFGRAQENNFTVEVPEKDTGLVSSDHRYNASGFTYLLEEVEKKLRRGGVVFNETHRFSLREGINCSAQNSTQIVDRGNRVAITWGPVTS